MGIPECIVSKASKSIRVRCTFRSSSAAHKEVRGGGVNERPTAATAQHTHGLSLATVQRYSSSGTGSPQYDGTWGFVINESGFRIQLHWSTCHYHAPHLTSSSSLTTTQASRQRSVMKVIPLSLHQRLPLPSASPSALRNIFSFITLLVGEDPDETRCKNAPIRDV
jgi:hypothetical protein